ncbi:MAG TPA: DUF2071 domain-containing protein [Herpetosiphonaceae bacterium]
MTPRQRLRFNADLLTQPRHRPWDVVTTLRHFAIVTYTLDPERLVPHLHPRFEPDCIQLPDGQQRALLSVVPFHDEAFHFVGAPLIRWSFGQTNYRAYVRDRVTGDRAVWFFGTTLDSASVLIPRYLWKLPWHAGRISFDCHIDPQTQRYTQYRMETRSRWAPAMLDLADSGAPVTALSGFDDLETALVVLTHPLKGYYYRRDGALGSYTIWHDQLNPTIAQCNDAQFPLLDRLGLVPPADQRAPHSVLLQSETRFSIYLPPRQVAT